MSQQQLEQKLSWIPLGKGAYNEAFVSVENVQMENFFGKLVKKIPRNIHETLSDVDRLSPKFHEIYPQFSVAFEKSQPYVIQLQKPPVGYNQIDREVVYLFESTPGEIGIVFKTTEDTLCVKNSAKRRPIFHYTVKREILKSIRNKQNLTPALEKTIIEQLNLSKHSLYLPFFGYQAPTDEETQQEILNIYQKTRNIIADGRGQGNFKKFNDAVFCVDYDYAVRRGSIVSQQSFFESRYTTAEFEKYWNKLERTNVNLKSTRLIRNLVYIEKHLRPEEITNDLLTLDILEQLHYLREISYPLTRNDLVMIKKMIEYSPVEAQVIHHFLPIFLNMLRPYIGLEEFPSMIQSILLTLIPVLDIMQTEDTPEMQEDIEINPSILSPK